MKQHTRMDWEHGVLLGTLVGGAHFGGDAHQPQVTLKMHVRHEPLLRFVLTVAPGGRLYGPYRHGGRHYFQLMYRGEALRTQLVPLLDALPWREIDPYSFERFAAMKARYGIGDREKFPVKLFAPNRADLALSHVLPAGSLFAVGGRVRDEIRASSEGAVSPAKDLDYVVVGVSQDDLARRLGVLGPIDLVGASFAVFKVSVDGLAVDVALPRREVSIGTGHRDFAAISGPDIPLQDDLARRDFRMNMLARSIPSGELIDPFGGEADIRAGRIDVLRVEAFDEDPLRLLRACQFAARFGYAPTAPTLRAMCAASPLVETVSADRITDELVKLLALAPVPSIGIELMRETGLLAIIWPELLEGVGVEQNDWHAHDVYRHALATLDATPPGDPVLRLAALFHDVGKPRTKDGPHFYRHEIVGTEVVTSALARLRLPRDLAATVARLVRQHMYSADVGAGDAAIRRFVRRIGVENLNRQFALRAADIVGSGLPKRDDTNERFQARVWSEVARRPPLSVTDLRVGGADVMQAMVESGNAPVGFRGDARVGALLRHLLEQVTEDPERNEPDTLKRLLRAHLQG